MEPLEDFKKDPAQQTEVAPPEGPIEDNLDIGHAEFDFKSAITKLIEVIQWSVAVLEITLLIRFFFKLFGAESANPFVGFLYALTDVILILFTNIFHPLMIHPNNVLEWSTLVGMLMIWLIFRAIRGLLRIVVSEPEEQPS